MEPSEPVQACNGLALFFMNPIRVLIYIDSNYSILVENCIINYTVQNILAD